MSRPGTPDLFESCGMLQPLARLACSTLSPNTGLLYWARGAVLHSDLWRIPLLRRWVNSADATLKALDASRALGPTEGRSLLPPPIHPAPPCSASVQRT